MASLERSREPGLNPEPNLKGGWIFAASSAGASVKRPDAPRHMDPLPPAIRCSIFGEWLVLRGVPAEGGRGSGLPLTCAEEITRALRGALMSHAIDPPPAALSGHTLDGRRLERPHAAFLALPDMGSPGRRATIAGAAIAFPRKIDPDARGAILVAAARWERSGLRLVLGRLGAMQLSRVDAAAPGDPLDPARWLGPARRWASVTPIALERNPGKLTARDPAVAAHAARRAEEIVTRGCAHIGLPRPTRVRVMRRSAFPWIPSAPEFMPFPRRPVAACSDSDKFKRVCVHVALEFAEPVEGPVLLGAGRHFGVGLCGSVVRRPGPSTRCSNPALAERP